MIKRRMFDHRADTASLPKLVEKAVLCVLISHMNFPTAKLLALL